MASRKILILIGSILLCLLAGLIGSFFTFSAIPTWYQSLNKPSFNPPDYIFAPVWTTLYILMGISLFLLIISRNKAHHNTKKKALRLFLIQLVLNSLWSIIFFGIKFPLLAFIEIIFLWIFVLLTIIYSFKISKISSLLLIPYFLWISFASILNYYIFILN